MTAQLLAFPQRHDDAGVAWEPWVSGKDLAAHLGVCERTVDNFRHAGMPSQKFGRSRRYQVARCVEWLSLRATNERGTS